MKKNLERLTLHRETLARLEPHRVQSVQGGAPPFTKNPSCCPLSCSCPPFSAGNC